MRIIKGIFFFTSLLLILFLGIEFIISSLNEQKLQTQVVSPIIETVNKSEEKILSLFTNKLDEVVSNQLKGAKGNYALVIKNLQTEETYRLNSDQLYPTASLYKLWTMAVVYDYLNNERLKKEQILARDVAELNKAFSIASAETELAEGTIELTVEDALNKMIALSDNYAALLLTKEVGIVSLQRFLKQESMTLSKTGSPPVTTANDIARFFEKLYKKELISSQYSEEMLDLLLQQTINDRIPKYLPSSVRVAHKTGELGKVKHDAGIVFTEKGDYIFVMLTETNDPQQAAELIARTSEDVYTYFTQKE
jgi:beta-lactamase class A